MTSLVLLRHGQSVWNHERRFTGWADVELSAQGYAEAQTAGTLLSDAGYAFDICFTSVLQRAHRTVDIVLETLGQSTLPIHTSWRLNERHYGALQGLSRAETALKYSPEQVTMWQQHFNIRPPALATNDPRFPGNDPRYAQLSARDLPFTESIKDVRSRVLPYWHETIVPRVAAGERVLIVAHGNSLRALTTYIEGALEEDIAATKRPLTGEPFIYEFNYDGKPVRHFYLRRPPRLQRWAKLTLRSTKSTLNSIFRKSAK